MDSTKTLTPPSTGLPGEGESRAGVGASLLAVRELPIAVALAVVIAVTTLRQPSFLSGENLRNIFLAVSLVLIVAMGQTVVILTRGIDISVGSAMGMAGMTTAVLYQQQRIDSLAAGVAVALLVGGAGGAFNGLLVAAARVPPIIATLGTFGLYRAVAFMVSGGHTVSESEMPPAVRGLSVNVLVGVAFVIAMMTFVLLRYTRLGRDVYAVGGNTDAARLRGVAVRRVTFAAYLFSGAAAGLAGLLYAPQYGSINPEQIGLGRELAAIAACAVGGVSIFGGSGGVAGVVLGALLLGTIETALSVLHVPAGWQLTAYGAAILVAVTFDALAGRLRRA